MGELSTNIAFHFQFYEKDLHEMDANTLLEAEKSIVYYINFLSKELDLDIETRITARTEGSLWDNFKFIYNNPLTGVLLGAILSKFLAPKPKLSDEASTEKTIANYNQLKQPIKNGDMTSEEALSFFETDKALKKHKSVFFNALQEDSTVKELDVAANDDFEHKPIPRAEFHHRIYSEEELKDEVIEIPKVLVD